MGPPADQWELNGIKKRRPLHESSEHVHKPIPDPQTGGSNYTNLGRALKNSVRQAADGGAIAAGFRTRVRQAE